MQSLSPPALATHRRPLIAGSTFLEMPGVGEFQNLEAPDQFDAAVLKFFKLRRQLVH